MMGCSWKQRLWLCAALLCAGAAGGRAADARYCNASQQAVCGDKCVSFAWLCNEEIDCPDAKDENCEEACRGDTNAFQCDNGKCISSTWNCDGVSDCMDGSDERDCVCTGGKVKCLKTPQCIDSWQVCDDHSDCDDGSDEASCPESQCLERQWHCKNKVCIMENWKCNGINDCGDASDEETCGNPDSCSEGMYRCDAIKCLPESLLCNGVADCTDGTDEQSTCGRNCSVDNGGCMQECANVNWGVRCSCSAGWKLQDQTCEDVDECAIDLSPCNQLCNNTIGSFTCGCLEGFQLKLDTVCEVSDDATLILLTVNGELVIVDVRTGESQSLVSIRGVPIAVAYDLFRESYFWVDENLNLQVYKIGSNNHTQLYPGVSGVNSIAVDWLMGQVFWASTLQKMICAGLSDGRGYVKILDKNVVPEQLTLFLTKRYMFWINYGRRGITALEVAGMDGSDRRVLAAVPMEQPVGLTLDYISSRLYWISAYKESIETINIDGSGRISFPDVLKNDQDPVGLAVFEGWFFWAYENQLLFASRNNLKEKEMLLNGSLISAFTVLHELQQPRSYTSPCNPGVCSHICLLSPVHVKGYKCRCPDGTFLLPSGKCENLKIMYASGRRIYLVEIGSSRAPVKRAIVQELSRNLNLMEVDWKRNLVYWTDNSGQLLRASGQLGSVQVLPTGGAVCTATVDIGTGNIYWLSCDGKNIQVTRFLGMGTKKLYEAETTIQHMFLDWTRASLYWIETTKPLQCMNLSGGEVRSVWNGTIPEVAEVFLDIKSNSILWNSADIGLQSLSLSKGRVFTWMKKWTHVLAAVYEQYLASINETGLVVWDRRTMEVFTTFKEGNISKMIIFNSDQVKESNSICSLENGGCTTDEICISGPGGVISCLCPDDRLNCLEVLDPSVDGIDSHPTLDCPSRFVPCRDGRECIASEFVCDGDRDCADGSDEEDCFKFCNKHGMFRCSDGKKCFEERFHCDGVPQCSDGSDELDCWKPTEDCALRCDQKTRCIPKSWICDANPDCFDESDERDCVPKECSSSKFACANGQCISFSMHCDGDNDCEDHSDEQGCTIPKPQRCRSGEMKCQRSGECYLKEWLCDGEVDCQDGTDEKDCKLEPTTCSELQLSCASGDECVPDFWQCDGIKDCRDGSDEECPPTKCQSNQFQCDTFECIPAAMACNGVRNCIDGSDEGGKCSSACKGMCAHSCYKSPYGPRCGCEKGFRLSSDKNGCIDINECKELDSPPCSQTCVNKNGTFSCTCHPGYLLEPDGNTCKVTGSEPLLVVAIQFDMILFGLRSLKEDIVISIEKNLMIFSIDYDIIEQKIFWMDLNAESIKWVTVDAKNKGTLVKGIKSDCIAVDWIGRNVYWTDGTAGAILATQLNGTWKGSLDYTIVLDEDLEQPRSLALQPLSGLMYWSEIGTPPQIEQAGMDGTDRRVLVKEKLGWPTGLALDLLSWKIFWSDDKFHCIGSANLDGSNIKVIQMKKIQSPFSLTVFEDEVYWSEMKARTVQKMDKKTGKNPMALIKRRGQPYGLKVMHEVMQPRASNPCLNFGCSHLCLVGPGLKGSCWCFVGMLLANDGKNCVSFKDTAFLLMAFPTVITQLYLRKLPAAGRNSLPDHNDIPLTNVNQISSIDYIVQERSLYFAVSKGDFIGLSKFKDAGTVSWKKVLAVEDMVTALAVDWMSGNIYWISTLKPYIQVATSSGIYTLVLISDGLYSPSCIALYPPTGVMCYADMGTEDQKNVPKIECASMDGSRRKVLWKKLKMPVGLVFADSGTRLYWADRLRGVIETVQLDGSMYKMIRGGLRSLGLFTFGEGMLFWTTLVNGTTRVYYSKLELSENYWAQVDQKIVDLRMYSKLLQQGTNGCSEDNACSQLCLPTPDGGVCMCSVGYHWIDESVDCAEDVRCIEGSQPCKDGQRCISAGQVCDGWADCLDRSDETDCEILDKGKVIPIVPPAKTSQPERRTTASRQLPFEDAHYTTRKAPGAKVTSPPLESTGLKDNQAKDLPLNTDIGRNMESRPCSAETCNMRGICVVEGGQVKCKCESEYLGDFCEEERLAPIAGKLTGGAIAILLAIVAAAAMFAFFKKRKSLERTSSTASSRTLTRQAMMESDEDVEGLTTTETFVNDAYDARAVAEEELATPLRSK